ncbi:hypothetical protein ACFL02_03435 [Planctomycetota bacterium]
MGDIEKKVKRKLIFTESTIQWSDGTCSPIKAENAQWHLIRAILCHGKISWLDSFLIFDRWRKGTQVGDYLSLFQSASAKVKDVFEEIGIKGVRMISKADGHSRILFFPKGEHLDSNISEAVELAKSGVTYFRRGDSESGWSMVRKVYEIWSDPQLLLTVINHAINLPKYPSDFNDCLSGIKTIIEEFERILIEAITKVSDLASQRLQGITFGNCKENIARWITMIGDVREAQYLLSETEIQPSKENEDIEEEIRKFVQLATHLSDYVCNDQYSEKSKNITLSMVEKTELDSLVEKLCKCDLVLHVKNDVIDYYEKLPHLGIDAKDINAYLSSAVYNFIENEPKPIQTRSILSVRFAKYLRLYIQHVYTTREICEKCKSDNIYNTQKRHLILSILDKIKGSKDIEELSITQMTGILTDFYRMVPEELRDNLCKFESFISDRTTDFVGRDFIFKQIDKYIADSNFPSGYIIIRGDPGIGKSSLMAQLINTKGYIVHHFNIALQSINTPQLFLGNICARLIGLYQLPYNILPKGYYENGSFFNSIIGQISEILDAHNPLVIIIDALDEVKYPQELGISNPLYLPFSLPNDIYIVMTVRNKYEFTFQSTNVRELLLEPKSEENKKDIREYIECCLSKEGVKNWMKNHGIDNNNFVDLMWQKSEGNFMYLRHVIPAIERGRFSKGTMNELPQGLLAYYRSHWTQMQKYDFERFERICQPVVCVLAAAQEAVSVDQISEWTKLEQVQVQNVFKEWLEFLHLESGPKSEKQYRIYHSAFREFLQEEVDPGLKIYHAMIARSALAKVKKAKTENQINE